MRSSLLKAFLILACLPGAAACSSDPANSPPPGDGAGGSGGSATGAGGAGGAGGTAPLCDPTPVACADNIILEMNLQTDIAPGKVDNAADGAGFISTVDARAGGFGAADPDSYVHVRFTDAGLEKVSISDQDSLDSMDWDMGFRRFVLRVNSGDSGPSCVTVARVPGTVAFDDYTMASNNLTYKVDDYFTDSCDLIPDGSGLGSPATALSSYWEYPGCVKMTNHLYVVQLRDGRKVKFTVLSYYSEAAQMECDTTNMTSSAGSAIFRVRWAFLP